MRGDSDFMISTAIAVAILWGKCALAAWRLKHEYARRLLCVEFLLVEICQMQTTLVVAYNFFHISAICCISIHELPHKMATWCYAHFADVTPCVVPQFN